MKLPKSRNFLLVLKAKLGFTSCFTIGSGSPRVSSRSYLWRPCYHLQFILPRNSLLLLIICRPCPHYLKLKITRKPYDFTAEMTSYRPDFYFFVDTDSWVVKTTRHYLLLKRGSNFNKVQDEKCDLILLFIYEFYITHVFYFYSTHISLDRVLNNKLFIVYSHLYNVAYHNLSLHFNRIG